MVSVIEPSVSVTFILVNCIALAGVRSGLSGREYVGGTSDEGLDVSMQKVDFPLKLAQTAAIMEVSYPWPCS